MAVTITATELADLIGGRADQSAEPARLLAVGTAMVEDYAPEAPEALQNEAVIRFCGYLAQADFGTVREETLGPHSVGWITNHAAAFRNSGAAALLTRYRVRRAGRIG